MRRSTDEADLFQHLKLEEPSDHVDRSIEMFARARAIEYRRHGRRKKLLQGVAIAAAMLFSVFLLWPPGTSERAPASEVAGSGTSGNPAEGALAEDALTENRAAEAELPGRVPERTTPASSPSLKGAIDELFEAVQLLESRLPEIPADREAERQLLEERLLECRRKLERLEAEEQHLIETAPHRDSASSR